MDDTMTLIFIAGGVSGLSGVLLGIMLAAILGAHRPPAPGPITRALCKAQDTPSAGVRK